MAKPYIIEFTIRTVVMADDESDAWSAGSDAFSEIARDEVASIDVCGEVKSAKDLPLEWDLKCIPYGGDGSTRLEQLLISKESP